MTQNLPIDFITSFPWLLSDSIREFKSQFESYEKLNGEVLAKKYGFLIKKLTDQPNAFYAAQVKLSQMALIKRFENDFGFAMNYAEDMVRKVYRDIPDDGPNRNALIDYLTFVFLERYTYIMHIVFDASQFDSIFASSWLNPAVKSDSEMGYNNYMPKQISVHKKLLRDGMNFLQNEGFSCYCNTIYQYMFGFTDLFDFAFKNMEKHDWKETQTVNRIESNSLPFVMMVDDQIADVAFRFIDLGSKVDKYYVYQFMTVPWKTEIKYDKGVVENTLQISNWIRAGRSNAVFDLVHLNSVLILGTAVTNGNRTGDSGEFYHGLLQKLGIYDFFTPKFAITFYVTNDQLNTRLKLADTIQDVDSRLVKAFISSCIEAGIKWDALNPSMVLNSGLPMNVPGPSTRPIYNFMKRDYQYGFFNPSYGLGRNPDVTNTFQPYIEIHRSTEEGFVKLLRDECNAEMRLVNLPNLMYLDSLTLDLATFGKWKEPFFNVDTDYDPTNRYGRLEEVQNDIEVDSLQGKDTYIITCIICHYSRIISTIHPRKANPRSDHYWCYIRDIRDGKWFRYDDSQRHGFYYKQKWNLDGISSSQIDQKSDRAKFLNTMARELTVNGVGAFYMKKTVFMQYQKYTI